MKKKIMVVDDDVEFLNEISETLAESGYDVVSFGDGESALKIALEIMPDVIMLDLKMEKISGFQVADKLNRTPETANIPIIAMTGYFNNQEHGAPMSLCGIKKCLMKPFDPEDMIKEIEKISALGGNRNPAESDPDNPLDKWCP